MPEDLKLEIGKSYNIDYVIKELEKYPEVQLGHIVISMTNEHKYHVNKRQLEEIAKKVKAAIAKGGKEYEKIGKKFVPLTDITILSVMDPYAKFAKYDRFYRSFEDYIVAGIEESKSGSVAAAADIIINEARKIGIAIDKDEEGDFLDGMEIFFKRRGITASPISGGKYIIFQKTIPGEIGVLRKFKIPDIETAKKEYEKYSQYTGFYDSFFKYITQHLEESNKEKIAASVDAIIVEAEKTGYLAVGKEKEENDLLKGMELYFNIRGIKVEKMNDDYAVFKR